MIGLNDKIWQKDGTVVPDVRKKLLQIARRFLDDFITPVTVKNIYLLGSIASYQWTPSSDIDLHITVDINEPHGNPSMLDYFDLKKDHFNKNHNIYIKGYKVEVNIKEEVEEQKQFYKNKPIYDLYNQIWIQMPNMTTRKLNDPLVLEFLSYFKQRIDQIIQQEAPYHEFKKLKNTIKALRKQGLINDGEYAVGNLIFKKLRDSKLNERLFNFKNDLEDKELSLEKFEFGDGYGNRTHARPSSREHSL